MIDGTIDAIATDHAPHDKDEKEIEFALAMNGIVGLETSLGAGCYKPCQDRKINNDAADRKDVGQPGENYKSRQGLFICWKSG